MKRFRFPLESVRVVREQRERQAMQNYAAAIRAAEAVARRLQALNGRLEECRVYLRGQLAAGSSGRGLAHTRAFVSLLEEGQQKLEIERRAAQAQLQQAWRVLLAATRDCQALDRYHDRLLRVHLGHQAREEQKTLDELGARLVAAASSHRPQPSNRITVA
jgi:flagellar export protein FliJ